MPITERLMQHQVDPAHLGRQLIQLLLISHSLETLLPQIIGIVKTFCCGDGYFVATLSADGLAVQAAYWQLATQVGESDETTGWTGLSELTATSPTSFSPISPEHPILLKILESAESVVISDLQDWEESGPFFKGAELPWRSILGKTTRLGADANGLILVGRQLPYLWATSEQQQLEIVADLVAVAFSYAAKAQEVATLQQQMQRQRQYQTLLSWLTSVIDTPLEPEQILQLAIEGTADTLQADQGLILLVKYSDPLYKTRAPHQIPKAKITVISQWSVLEAGKQEPEDKSEGSWRPSFEARQPTENLRDVSPAPLPSFWLADCRLCQEAFVRAPKNLVISDLPQFLKAPPETGTILSANTRSVLFVPITGTTAQGTILGFLVLLHSQVRCWQAKELEVAELVAAQLSTTLIQNRTLKQVQALVEDRTAQLQRSLDVQAKLYEQSRRQVEQRRRLNQLKDEFVNTLSHELRTPLTSMTMAIRMLRDYDLSPASRTKYLDILEQQCLQETKLVNDLLTLQELEKLESQQTPLTRQLINLKSVIDAVAQEFNTKWADKGLTLTVNLPRRSLRLQTDPDSLQRILVELLTNAGKYSMVGTPVVLEAAGSSSEIVITITNLGRAIAPDDLPDIFEKFRRGAGVTKQVIPGTGLGLALVKCLVQHLNGTITASSSPSEMPELLNGWLTCFTLTLPHLHELEVNREE